MKTATTSLLITMSAALLCCTHRSGVQAFKGISANNSILRSISSIVGGGDKNKAGDNKNKNVFVTSRTTTVRNLFNSIFGGGSDGIDYSTLKVHICAIIHGKGKDVTG